MLSEHISSQIYSKFGFVPTIGQKKLIDALAGFITDDAPERIMMVNGYAGTGKTSVVAAMVRVLGDFNIPCVLLAPTGRAAKVMSQYAGVPAYTIHKRIYRQRSLSDTNARFDIDINKSKDAFFIVDEASMLSNYSSGESGFGSGHLLDDLVRYVQSGRGCKLMVVGDSAQLPPIGTDESPALDPSYMGAYGEVTCCTLDEVVRQQQQSGILFNATLVRCMLENNIVDIPLFETGFPDIKVIGGGDFLDEFSDSYYRYGENETIVVTRSNKRAVSFNEGIRRHVLAQEEEIGPGDMVMVVKNNYHYVEQQKIEEVGFIANGDIAEIVRIRRYEELYGFRFADVLLRFPDYNDLELDCKVNLDTLSSTSPSLTSEQSKQLFFAIEEDYADITVKQKRYRQIVENPHYNALQIKFAYAVTCHKAQGGQWKCIFIDKMLFGDEQMTRDLMRWLYTAITRATEKVYFVNFDDRFFG